MRVKLQLVICHDDGHEETVTDVITLNKNNQRIEHLGLSLAESKQLLSTLCKFFRLAARYFGRSMAPSRVADEPVSSLRKLMAMLSSGRAGFRREFLEIKEIERHHSTHTVRASPKNGVFERSSQQCSGCHLSPKKWCRRTKEFTDTSNGVGCVSRH